MVTCAAKNCKTKSGQGIHLFTFPKDTERRKLWLENLNRVNFKPAVQTRLCALHFTPDQFVINPILAKSIGYFSSKRNDLKDIAVPTIFNKDTSEKRSHSTQLETLDLQEQDSSMDSSEGNTCLYDKSVVANIKQEAPDIDESQDYPYYYGSSQNGQSNTDPFEQSFPLHPGFICEESQASQGTDEESVGNGINDAAMFMTLTQELNQQGELLDNTVNENMEVNSEENDINGESYELPVDGTFRCKYCCIRFVSFTALTEHINRLHQNKYKCRYCSKSFVRCQELAGHVRQTHLKGGSHATLKLDDSMMYTNNTETDDTSFNSPDFKPYESSEFGQFFRCMYCYAKLSSEELVKDHIVRLHTSKYQCKYCSDTFNRSQELAGHVRKLHLEEKQVFDVYKKHRPVSSLSQPARKSYDVSGKPYKKVKAKVTLLSTGYSKYKCGYCSMVFFKQQAMACHVRNAHKSKKSPEGKKESKSRKVYKEYKKKAKLKLDKHQEKLYSVDTVIKKEQQTEDYVESTVGKEQEDYTEIRQEKSEYTCRYCMLIFTRSQDLACHTRVSHPVTYSHWCKYCPSTFTSKERLINHVLCHLREELRVSKKGYSSCHLCRLSYPSLNSLRNHLRIHFKGKKHKILDYLLECKFCGQPFLTKPCCEEHEEKHKIKNSESKTKIKMELKQEKKVKEMSDNLSVKDEGKPMLDTVPIRDDHVASLDAISVKDGGKLNLDGIPVKERNILDEIPFQCGMCTSRFPSSQYLLHHMTLHMEGKYVFKVEKDKDKEQQESEMKKYCEKLKSIVNTKQIIIPKVSNIDINSPKHRVIFVKSNKTEVPSVGGVGGDLAVNKKEGDTEMKHTGSENLASIKTILKAHLGKTMKAGKNSDREITNKNQIEVEAKYQFYTKCEPNYDKIDELKFKQAEVRSDERTSEVKNNCHVKQHVKIDTDNTDSDFESNCLNEENESSEYNEEYPLIAEIPIQKRHNKPISKKKFKKGIDFANGQWQECEYCMFLCVNQKEYENHMDGHKKSLATLLNCKLCSRKFVSKWHLTRHMESHRSNDYQCTFCHKSFCTSFQVLEHMSVHASDNS